MPPIVMKKTISLFFLLSYLLTVAYAQATNLNPNDNLERNIVGGETHTYQIMLQAGQFTCLVVEQKAIDLTLEFSRPRSGPNQPTVEINLTGASGIESYSVEAATTGEYTLKISGIGVATIAGAYHIRLETRPMATAQDKQRLAAEALLIEAQGLRSQASKAAEQVIAKLQSALSIWRELNEPYWSAWCLSIMGGAYFDSGRNEQAIEYQKQARAIQQAIQDRIGEARSLTRMGNAYYRASQIEQAIECYQQSQAIHREVKDRAGEGQALNNLANASLILNRYEQALEAFEQALVIAREVKNRISEARTIANLGGVYLSLQRQEKAIEYFERALVIDRETKDKNDEAAGLTSLGVAHEELGHYEQAITCYEQALALNREMKNRINEGIALHNLGNVYRNLDRYEQAVTYYEQALAIHREVKNSFAEARTLTSLGNANRNLGRYEQALQLQLEALAIWRRIKDRSSEAYTLYSLARTAEAQGHIAMACSHIEESLRIVESLRAEFLSPESRISFLSNAQNSYQLYADLLMRRHKAEPTKDYNALALAVSEQQRARSLLDLLTESRTDLRAGVEASLIERERTLAQQLNQKAQTQAKTAEAAAALKLEISQLETDLERTQVAIRRANPHYAAVTQPQPLTLKEIQQQLDADTLLLEYSLGAERSYVWAITKDSLTSYELPKETVITAAARQVYELLIAPSITKRGETIGQRRQRIAEANAKLPAAATALSQMILAPVAAQLGNKRLVIVADGALQYVPFAMLPEPPVVRGQLFVAKNSGQPLIVKHEMVSLPSASALAIQRNELAARMPAPKALAVIADPVFDRSDARLARLTNVNSDGTPTRSLDDQRSIVHLAEKSDDSTNAATRKLVIPRLPFTNQEAAQLLALAPKEATFGALGFQANRAVVMSSRLSQYRYVHFATHGVLDSERPGLSSLLLSMVDEQGKPQDGFLRANDIYNLKLPAELVVLSACQTGLGKEIKGEGLVGLTRGFMYAGAARVVVSLWNVNDQATAELMTKFYQKMLKQSQRPAAALRAAQVEMWRQKQWNAPFYWAAFTLQGEWR